MKCLILMFVGLLIGLAPAWAQESVPQQRIEELVHQLDHNDWSEREKAMTELRKLPKTDVPRLRAMLDGPLSAEQSRRLETVLTSLGDLSEMDRRILREILQGNSLVDLMAAYATYGDGLKRESYGTLLKGEKTVSVELVENETIDGAYNLVLSLERDTAAWIPAVSPTLDVQMNIDFPKVTLKGGGTDVIEMYLTRMGDFTKYVSNGTSCSTGQSYRRYVGPKPTFATLQVTKRYVPGTYKFRLQTWGQGGGLEILGKAGVVDTVRKASVYDSRNLDVKVDPFEDYNLALPSFMNANNFRNYDFNVDAELPETLEAGTKQTVPVRMTPFARQANYFFILPDFEDGNYLTVYWRRMGVDSKGKPKVVEQITQRLDSRKNVAFDIKTSKYISLYTLQTAGRELTLNVPKTPGTWEMVICYGAFAWKGRMNTYQPFTMLRHNRSYAFFPMGVIPSRIYKLEIK